jgi:methionine-rich copper-binding protein CopC
MQVVHSVKLSKGEKAELLALAEVVATARTSVAFSTEERPAEIEKATNAFCNAIKDAIHMAFSYGYNEGLNNANLKDTDMYKPIEASPL